MDSDSSDSLWAFACSFYDFADVKQHCLELQNCYAADVDIVLWLCWLPQVDVSLCQSALPRALEEIGGGDQQFLQMLRQLRGPMLKGSSFSGDEQKELRRQVLAAELTVEAVFLQRLQTLTSRLPAAGKGEKPLALEDYLATLSALDPESSRARAQRLLQQARAFRGRN